MHIRGLIRDRYTYHSYTCVTIMFTGWRTPGSRLCMYTHTYQWWEEEEEKEDSIGHQVTLEEEGDAIGDGNTSPAGE